MSQPSTTVIYAGATGLGVIWAYFYIPETNGRSEFLFWILVEVREWRADNGRSTTASAEIDILFEHRIPARKWKTTDVSRLIHADI